LAHFLRSGDLTEVFVPDEAVEAMRDLERARDDAKCAERAARHQLSKFLLRHDRRWEGTTWTMKHHDWIRSQKFAYPAQQRVLEDYLKTVEDLAERVERLNQRLYHLVHVGKSVQKAVVAVARELAGFLWAVGQEETLLEAV
jgi:transposase